MKLPLSWLNEYIKFEKSFDEIAENLTMIGNEVESIDQIGNISGVIVCEILEINKHPNADKLQITKLYDGSNYYSVVCGAPNIRIGQKIFLATIGTKLPDSDNDTFLDISSYFTQGQPLYMILYASGIIFFTFFYTSITFNPTETAENLRKYGGFIPGIRPGESTALYIENILTKLTTIGALYLTLVCLMPEFLIANYPIPFYLGGTSILIVVVVAIDTVTQIQTRLMSSQYEQLIKKTKFGK